MRKVGSPVAPMFDDEFLTVLSALPPPLPPTISLSLAPSTLGADNSDDPVVFSIEVSSAAILLKLWMNRQ